MRALILFLALLIVASCAQNVMNNNKRDMGNMNIDGDPQFKRMCQNMNYDWMLMKPTKDGKIMYEEKSCWGCMVEGIEHVCDKETFMEIVGSMPHVALKPLEIEEMKPVLLEFHIKNTDETPAKLVVSHEKLLHAIIISEDFSSFSHLHPEQKENGIFTLNHQFRKSGKYIVGVDYATESGHYSESFIVDVKGNDKNEIKRNFSKQKNFEGYDIKLTIGDLAPEKEATLKYHIEKNGKPVINMAPYLAAPMHVAIVKEDLSEFMHVHGEVNLEDEMGTMDMEHNMTMDIPSSFGPEIEAHATFPSSGIYNVFGEFKHDNKIIVTLFMVEVK